MATTPASSPSARVIDDVMMSRNHIGSADQTQTTLWMMIYCYDNVKSSNKCADRRIANAGALQTVRVPDRAHARRWM